MALHALRYCERLFYLEEVEELRVADAAVYAGRTIHEQQGAREEGPETRSFSLSSEKLGLTGRVDALRRADGGWVPLEIKRGRARRDGTTPVAWDSDAVQVAAYAMMLEEASGTQVPEGHIRYMADDVTVSVKVDSTMRAEVQKAIQRARELRNALERPPVTEDDRRCLRCSLAPVCLPEEERLARDSRWQPVRLFPPGRTGRVLHITDHRARIGRAGEVLTVTTEGETIRYPLHEVEAVVIHGYAQMSTQALHLCAAHQVGVHWLTPGGRYAGGLASGPGPVRRRLRQYRTHQSRAMRLHIARRIALAKVEGQLRYLLRATRGRERPAAVENGVNQIRTALKTIKTATSVDTIRGAEGSAARAYLGLVPLLLGERVPRELVPAGRSRRPPTDRFNALLSFGYALLYQAVLRSILTVGLDPALGFYHTPRSEAHPLVLDLMELFRLPVWDMPLIGSINRLQWDVAEDFSVTKARVWLSPSGRKKAIQIFEQRLQEVWKHPVTEYSLSYERAMELEVRLLEKEWSGEPGLFARLRLR